MTAPIGLAALTTTTLPVPGAGGDAAAPASDQPFAQLLAKLSRRAELSALPRPVADPGADKSGDALELSAPAQGGTRRGADKSGDPGAGLLPVLPADATVVAAAAVPLASVPPTVPLRTAVAPPIPAAAPVQVVTAPTSGAQSSFSRPASDHDTPDLTPKPVTDADAAAQTFPFPAATPAPPPAAPTAPAAPSPIHAHPVTQPALTGAVTRLRNAPDGVHQVEVMLHPADLGTVQVTVRLHHGALDVTVACADDTARQAVAAALPALHRDLREVATSNVTIADPRPDPRPEQRPDADARQERRHPEPDPERRSPARHRPSTDGDFAVDGWM